MGPPLVHEGNTTLADVKHGGQRPKGAIIVIPKDTDELCCEGYGFGTGTVHSSYTRQIS